MKESHVSMNTDNDHNTPDESHSVTIIDVAREAGVSYTTVSRVLSGYEFVKESTRKRVMEAVERLGYVANLHARKLKGGRSQVIGLLVPHLEPNFLGTIMQGIDEELERANYDLMLYTTHRQQDKESNYANLIANGPTDGILLISPLIPSSYLHMLRERKFPYVLIGQNDPSGKSAVVDATYWQGAYDATRYLHQLGHRRIAFLAGTSSSRSAVERLVAYKAALSDCDIPYEEKLVVEGNYSPRGGYEATIALLREGDPPTAIFAANDLSAFGAIDAIRDSGLRVPEDISVVGFDDIPQAALVYPKLTTVHQPLVQMGRVAVKMLFEQIDGQQLMPQRITLATSLVIRDSCAPRQP